MQSLTENLRSYNILLKFLTWRYSGASEFYNLMEYHLSNGQQFRKKNLHSLHFKPDYNLSNNSVDYLIYCVIQLKKCNGTGCLDVLKLFLIIQSFCEYFLC